MLGTAGMEYNYKEKSKLNRTRAFPAAPLPPCLDLSTCLIYLLIVFNLDCLASLEDAYCFIYHVLTYSSLLIPHVFWPFCYFSFALYLCLFTFPPSLKPFSILSFLTFLDGDPQAPQSLLPLLTSFRTSFLLCPNGRVVGI